MILSGGETVTVLTRVTGTDDRYNKPSFTWPLPGTDIPLCGFDPGTSDETSAPYRKGLNTQPTVYDTSDGSVPVTSVDRMIVRGVTYQVDGEPADWTNPFTGTRFGREIKLARTDGA